MPRKLFPILSTSTLALAIFSLAPADTEACTSFLVSKGASADGSTMITYAADSHSLYGELYFTPRAKHPPGAKRQIVDWDSQKVLGEIDQPPETYHVVGNINEHQLAIAETTFGGREELRDPKGGIDYGSMIYVALERSKNAREAMRVMTDLANEHGYYSKGESFSIADPKEVWIMDLIGKGPDEKGVVWVACKVPDGYVTAHANQPRIRIFPQDDPEQCIFAEDVISFAKKKGYYEGPDEKFSFVDAYANLTCRDLRVREGRVYSFYNQIAPSQKIPPDYPACKPGSEPLPLWVKPDKKLTPQDLMIGMRDHFNDTIFDMRNDVGAGPFKLPYRWRPLTWEFEGKTYVNERATATQQTAFSFVSQSREGLPGEIGGLLWFSVDDAASTVYVPMYAGIREVPKPYAVGTATFEEFSWDSAFWVFNWVANFTYSRYMDMIKDVQKAQSELETGFFDAQADFEKKAIALHQTYPEQAARMLTQYSAEASDKVMTRWKDLGPELLVKYMDGNIRDEKGKPTHPPYEKEWYARIVAEKGEHLHLWDEDGGTPPPAASAAASAAPPAATPTPAPPRSGCSLGVSNDFGWPQAVLLLGLGGLMARRLRTRGS